MSDARANAGPDLANGNAAGRVLVVDDTDANRYALTRILMTAGFEVAEAATGREALRQARSAEPHLIVLDVKLPDIDGFEVCRRLKADPQTRLIPVLQVSASYVRPEDQAAGLEGGADAYLLQPVERQVLVATVNALMRIRRVEDELRAARDQAERSAKEAKEANAAKDQFLAALSHELRTPLTPVLTTVQLLQSKSSEMTPEVRDAIQLIRRNVELEARLIDDLLDLTKVAHGKIELLPQVVDVHDLIGNTLHICSADAVGKRQTLVVDLRARKFHVRGDSARLQQVLWNLCKNAVKFTPVCGTVTVRTENSDDERELIVRVIDTGVGIEAEMLPKIFNAFEQGGAWVTRQFGGLGLGLAISRALVDLHGGQLRAESPGKERGATFTLELLTVEPTRSDEPVVVAAPEERNPLTGLSILLVEDHEDSSRAMARVLQGLGYRVQTAATVEAARSAVKSHRFDLVVSDIGLPDGSGLDLMRGLASDDPTLKGIALSGYGMDEDRRRSAEAGFAAHLTKPVNIDQLERELGRLIGRPA